MIFFQIKSFKKCEGTFQLFHTTVDKTVSRFLLSDLAPDTPSYFRIRTITRPHNNNSNTLESLFSPDLSIVYTRNFPWISDISNQTIYQNSYIDISFSVGDDTGSQQNLNVSALSSNAGLVPLENLIISGSNTSKILRVSL
ncbi:hypothetical protein MHK_004185, partial [Candidatus Magnetomorum sp. HK-1]